MRIVLLVWLLLPLVASDGFITAKFSSDNPVIIKASFCPTFFCDDIDETAREHKLHPGTVLHLESREYSGKSMDRIGIHVHVLNIDTGEEIGTMGQQTAISNDWTFYKVTTKDSFDVSIAVKNHCKLHFFGNHCGTKCYFPEPTNFECDSNGRRRCKTGWELADCSKPMCENNCNNHGQCLAPGKCVCGDGFNGTNCEHCLAHPKCANGHCKDSKPGTCECRPGFLGSFCDLEDACARRSPCRNGARCRNDHFTKLGFICTCRSGFTGILCDHRSDRCDRTTCYNGGSCIDSGHQAVRCVCPVGFTGQLCEVSQPTDLPNCSACPDGTQCVMHDNAIDCVKVVIPSQLINDTANDIEADPTVAEGHGFMKFVFLSSLITVVVMIIRQKIQMPRASVSNHPHKV